MGYQIIAKMTHNAKNKQIETWQYSNNVWPKTDHFCDLNVKTDKQMFEFIKLVVSGSWQVRKRRKAFNILFEEYPELVMSSYEHELEGGFWEEYCAVCRKHEGFAEGKCNEIVARFRQLVGIV